MYVGPDDGDDEPLAEDPPLAKLVGGLARLTVEPAMFTAAPEPAELTGGLARLAGVLARLA
jgi:hypothetical protein